QRKAANKQIWSGLQTAVGGLGDLAGEFNLGGGGNNSGAAASGTYSPVSADASGVSTPNNSFNMTGSPTTTNRFSGLPNYGMSEEDSYTQ
ncbi:MAG: hypothetical protein KW793_04215, partial [Candidatus Doudnabacteria bacterium]|nr:hypothetical protein [Candidatus Doudnabacteria bacterium]